MAHWTEGNTNYLIGRVTDESSQKPTYKCIVYNEHTNGPANVINGNNRQSREQQNQDFIDLSAYNNEYSMESSKIQLSVSQDEFCRNIDNLVDDQSVSYIFTKLYGSKYNNLPSVSVSSFDLRLSRSAINIKSPNRHKLINTNCKFPKWLNKKWHNLKQTKLFTLDYKLDSLLVVDEKNSIVMNKYTCSHMKSVRKNSFVQAIVKSLNGWLVLLYFIIQFHMIL